MRKKHPTPILNRVQNSTFRALITCHHRVSSSLEGEDDVPRSSVGYLTPPPPPPPPPPLVPNCTSLCDGGSNNTCLHKGSSHSNNSLYEGLLVKSRWSWVITPPTTSASSSSTSHLRVSDRNRVIKFYLSLTSSAHTNH